MTDLELLARIILCEAGGEGDDGMRAVATVIMNRVRTFEGEYGRQNTLREVIFAPHQFECATQQPQNLWAVTPTDQHYDIASWALGGGQLGAVGNALWFFNPFSQICPETFPSLNGYFMVRIGLHCFYSPTATYFNT